MDRAAMMKEIRVEDAIGMVLAHDLTQIIPGKFKGRLFQKGHVIQQQDIPALLSIGKEHIYILDVQQGYLHEDDAAIRLAKAAAGKLVEWTEPHEGKSNIVSRIHGLAKIDKRFVDQVNRLGEIALATIPNNTVVHPSDKLAGTRVIPLLVEEEKVIQVEQLAQSRNADIENGQAWGHAGNGPIEVKPFKSLRVGLITTGNEVYHGRIEDKFGPKVEEKLSAFGSRVVEQRLVPDHVEEIVKQIRHFAEQGVDMILLTGGMSVDPDDRTPGAIKRAGAEIVSYGTPMLPGSMLLMAYLKDTPILGLPGCVMHDPHTSFDVLLPRICAGERITADEIADMGYGGLYSC
ncbi:molybdopterin-binding protein [Xylanibacillus composti]|nr:molybdopterin-binding protein [Xylanibacillus composti]MDT9723833.1 molybdopterin-binding protein [Xylanibacillus composti]